MSSVRMTHPDLPDQPIDVDEVSVSHYQSAGWQVAADQPDQATPPARRRRQPTRKDDSR